MVHGRAGRWCSLGRAAGAAPPAAAARGRGRTAAVSLEVGEPARQASRAAPAGAPSGRPVGRSGPGTARRRDDLHRPPVGRRRTRCAAPRGGDDLGEGALPGPRVEPAGQRQRERDVVGRVARLELVEEPEALLARTRAAGASSRDSRSDGRRQRPAWPEASAAPTRRASAAGVGDSKSSAQRQLDAERPADPGDQLRRRAASARRGRRSRRPRRRGRRRAPRRTGRPSAPRSACAARRFLRAARGGPRSAPAALRGRPCRSASAAARRAARRPRAPWRRAGAPRDARAARRPGGRRAAGLRAATSRRRAGAPRPGQGGP